MVKIGTRPRITVVAEFTNKIIDMKNKTTLNHKAPPIANAMLCEVVFTKDLFIETINKIEAQYNHDRKCAGAFKVLLPNDHTSGYDNHWLQNQLIKILKIAMNDNHTDSWIEYYLWELDFGRKWKKDSVKVDGKNFRLQNAYDLWDLLNLS